MDVKWISLLVALAVWTVPAEVAALRMAGGDVTPVANRKPCNFNVECRLHEVCKPELGCDCSNGYQPELTNDASTNCTKCYEPDEYCDPFSQFMRCCGEFVCNRDNTCVLRESGIDFSTVAKIALAAALVVTMVAVIGVFWRAFVQDRCCPHWRQTLPDAETTSINSIQRFIIRRMQDRPPRYDAHQDKPPSYAECFGDADPDASTSYLSSDPPPYSIALEEIQGGGATALPRYRLQVSPPDDELMTTPLNVQCIRLVTSPVTEMDDFAVYHSESESSDSIKYEDLSAEDNRHILDSSSTSSAEEVTEDLGIDNPACRLEQDRIE